MKLKHFFLAFAATLLLPVLLSGCYTVRTPYIADSYAPSCDYVILGRVTSKARVLQSGYSLLRSQAAQLYPEADDVIHVQVDAKQNILVFLLLKSYYYELSGLAIRYSTESKATLVPLLTQEMQAGSLGAEGNK